MKSKATVWRHWFPACLAATIALGTAACDPDLDPQFVIPGTGSLSGLIFFDASEDGVFDASDGDFGIPDLALSVRSRGTDQTVAGGTATTDADGRFEMAGLPAGSHEMLVDEATVPAGTFICQNPIPVTVFVNETQFADVRGRPGCLITIAEAKDLPAGEFVIVRGIVTSATDEVEAGWTFIQDASAGAKINSATLSGMGIEIGDQLEVGATNGAFSGDYELNNATLRELVKGVANPVPQVVTTGQIAASGATFTDPLQGALLQVQAAELTAAFGDAPGGNLQNGTVDDGSGAITIRIDDGVADRNNLNNLLTVGTCYDITGFGANFNGGGQIFPRSLPDIVEVACS